jgi:putative ABC transport system ATP-binding protein
MTDSADFVLEAQGLGKGYPDGKTTRRILENVDIIVRAGEMVGLMGPSGSGKSTLLSVVGGLLRPDSGAVAVCGEPLDYAKTSDIARIRREHIGWISQAYDLVLSESVAQNVSLPLVFDRPRLNKREREDAINAALTAAGLNVKTWRQVSKLSGGERQRVAIARALVRTPKFLIADEPTAALDEDTAAQIIEKFRGIADSGVAVLVATHDPQVVAVCDRMYRFDGSHVKEQSRASHL